MIRLFTMVLLAILINGCAELMSPEGGSPSSNSILRVSVPDESSSNSDFKRNMIRIAKRSEEKYNEYTELLIALKKNHTLKKSRIPRNLGKRFTFSFDGYALQLVKKICDEAGYSLLLADIRVADSKVMSRDYRSSMGVDILEDVSSDGGFNLEIDESKMEMVARLN